MTNEELIAEARERIKDLEGVAPHMAPLNEYSEVRVRDTVTIYLGRLRGDDYFEVCLDRETGELVGATYSPITPDGESEDDPDRWKRT